MSESVEGENRLKRWRLLLGGEEADGIGVALDERETGVDRTIAELYEGSLSTKGNRSSNMAGSSPRVAAWLGDVRKYFPVTIVQVMQRDALDRFDLKQLLLEPELLASTEPDIHLVTTLLSLKSLIPERTKSTAREVVGQLVEKIMQRLAGSLRQSVTGSLNRSSRNFNPRHNEIDWNKTIRVNLKHYQAEYETIIPVRRVGYSRRRSSQRDIILCIDQSGSMASSVVYAAVFGAVLASLPSVSTQLVAFDTSVVDLTDSLDDPIDLLFGIQLGGGTDINRALGYCQRLVHRPEDTVFVLISDLYEGGDKKEMLRRAAALVGVGVTVVALLALNDSGTPGYEHDTAKELCALGIPSFACTPDLFPDMIAAALLHQDLNEWAINNGIAVTSSLSNE